MNAQPAILFVDDEPSVTESLRRVLARLPYRVHTAGSGAEALETLRRHPIDVIVSDERMPGMTGCDLLCRVAIEFPRVVRIVLTGEASLDVAIRSINEARIFRFLTKPCRPEEVTACIEAAVAAREAEEPVPVAGPAGGCTEDSFDEALASLWLAFQPIVRPRRRGIFAYEALVRSHHPDLSGPLQLFDCAERLGRVHALEQAVRACASRAVHRLPADVSLLVNLHPQSFDDPDLFSVLDPLVPHAHRVVLEITERASLDEFADVAGKVEALRDFGFRIAIDDLGAGYSGLSSFAVLQPDTVKLDMSLVRDAHRSHTKLRLIGSMLELGRELGFDTIAEGVERVAEYRALVDVGCELFQGYLFARPGKAFPAPVFVEADEGRDEAERAQDREQEESAD